MLLQQQVLLLQLRAVHLLLLLRGARGVRPAMFDRLTDDLLELESYERGGERRLFAPSAAKCCCCSKFCCSTSKLCTCCCCCASPA